MKARQILFICALACAGLLLSYGISFIDAPNSGDVGSEFGFPSHESAVIDSQVGDFYILEVHEREEGGGYWVIAKKSHGVVVLVDQGQRAAPQCDALSVYEVPTQLVHNCLTTSGLDAQLVDRVTGAVATTTQAI